MYIGKFKSAVLLSYICIASASAAIITPALPRIEQAYQLSHGALEWVISIFLLGYVLGQLIYGPLANCFGRLAALRSGLIINIAGILLCIGAVYLMHYPTLLAGRLLTALGAASGLSCTFMLINELLPAAAAKRALSFAIVSFTLGIGIAVTLGGLITQYWHWQYCFWLLLGHGALMLALTWLFPETLEQPVSLRPMTIAMGYLKALKNRQLVIFSLTVGFVSTIGYGYSATAPIYAQDSLYLSPSHYGYWNLLNIIGMLSSGFLSAWLIKKYGESKLLLIGFIGLVPILLSLAGTAFALYSNTMWFFVTSMLLYLFSGLLFPAASYFASNALSDRASASSMMSFINIGSAMIGVIVIGYLPLPSILAFTVVLCAFFTVIVILLLIEFLTGIKTARTHSPK